MYLGVDIAGAKNTWTCLLEVEGEGRPTWHAPQSGLGLTAIAEMAEDREVRGAVIDAQLTWSPADENGFRESDVCLRNLLPAEFMPWVASQNSLMAVPVRGRQLAELLAPSVGTILETHPRSCLYFFLHLHHPDALGLVRAYKPGQGAAARLWELWCAHFGLRPAVPAEPPALVSDGALDALVCATVGMLYHLRPGCLLKLPDYAGNRRGRGPFYVLDPHRH